jgi:hypothetical protein
MAIEIVDLPINSMVIFHSYVSLPGGIYLVVHPMDRFCGFVHPSCQWNSVD